ncbi:MAG: 50S ribosomal L9 C-terminal domain-containing protein, partial [Pseudomonadota bacterium]
LFPQHLAFSAFAEHAHSKIQEKKDPKQEKADRALAAALDGQEFVIPVKMKGEKIDFPVTTKDIQTALKERGYKVNESNIITLPLSDLGTHTVAIDFPTGYEATVHVVVEEI